ncbi:MAG: phosphoribosylglycinamide formyltransferase [Anaerolineae bacterium]|nr:phosphoribosylglycinamide formyltransferase [Anaerolineae bacterium]
MTNRSRLVVLVSGSGSNLQAVLDACAQGVLEADVCAVVSNRADAFALERARQKGIPALLLEKLKEEDRESYDRRLADLIGTYHPDWVILAGWMRILTASFIGRFPNRVINLHPALPGMFPGTHAIERALQAFQDGQVEHTGVMVHLVPDEGVDCGPVILQQVVPISPAETLSSLEERIHAVEHVLLVAAIKQVIVDNQFVEG